MPELTRRLFRENHYQRWDIFDGDVRVGALTEIYGTGAKCSGAAEAMAKILPIRVLAGLGHSQKGIRPLLLAVPNPATTTVFKFDLGNRKRLPWCGKYFVPQEYVLSENIIAGTLNLAQKDRFHECFRARKLTFPLP